MTATPHQVIEFHYTLRNTAGEVLDQSGDTPFTCLTGVEQIVPGLEKVLVTMKAGEQRQVAVPAEEGYGERNEELLMKVERAKLPKELDLEEGAMLQGPGGEIVTVMGGDATHVFLDANHPLAGENLNFDVTIVSTRPATPEEVEHGHVHGAGGVVH